MKPTILIPCPTSFDTAYNDQCWPEYARAVEQSGGEPVLVPLSDGTILRGLQDRAQGILLPGSGADVSPSRYGHPTQPETAPADPLREATDLQLLEATELRGIPTLAICFGLQSLNVHRGGTLVQHLQPMPVNHRAGRAVAEAHSSIVATASALGEMLTGSAEVHLDAQPGFLRIMVNSSHHQAVGIPGDTLRVVARSAEDGVIEALEDPAHPFLIGVQWHPERTYDRSDASRQIFRSFLEAAKHHA